MGGSLGAWGGRWRARCGRRRSAAVWCHCGGAPAWVGGGNRAGEFQGTERKVVARSILIGMGWREGSACGRRAAAGMVEDGGVRCWERARSGLLIAGRYRG